MPALRECDPRTDLLSLRGDGEADRGRDGEAHCARTGSGHFGKGGIAMPLLGHILNDAIEAGYPIVRCPKCGDEQIDYDGFGFIACLPDGCGYCTHPTRSGAVCEICGDSEPGKDCEPLAE